MSRDGQDARRRSAGVFKRWRDGQSTLEYLLVVTAVLAVVIIIIGGVFRQNVNTLATNSAGTVQAAAGAVRTGVTATQR